MGRFDLTSKQTIQRQTRVIGLFGRKLLARIFVVLKEERPYELRSSMQIA